ncbi:MAG: pseudaminic acid synthase [Acidimicrobiales bacterium]|jgi:pseudaminic acid synthase|nr:pseudaminic acid synthase [Acidimicrobiales bacterium]
MPRDPITEPADKGAAVTPSIRIGSREVGTGHAVYVIAELSANHGGSLDRALSLVDLAAEAGADAVKLQTFTPETMTMKSDAPGFVVSGGTLWDGRTLHDLYSEAQTPWEWHPQLRDAAVARGIDLLSSPFDARAVDFLDKLGVPALKIASFELVDLELIERAASTNRPILMSTGMATAAEIGEAVSVARSSGSGGICLLRCNSAYPAPPYEMDLATIPDMMRNWAVPVGLSDHTLSATAAIASVALGACLIEKHFTLTRSEPGPDSAFSLEPHEFRTMVESIREAEAALGSVRYGPTTAEEASVMFRRSLHVGRHVAAGAALTRDDIAVVRPSHGLAPKHIDAVVGRRTKRALDRGTPLSWDDLLPE